jgi:hypothetical protein
MLCLGGIAITGSIVYTSSIFAFIGLGLTFWGALLLFIRPKKYVQANLLNPIATSSLETLNQIVKDLKLGGKAVYLPSKYSNYNESTVFIPFDKNAAPHATLSSAEGKLFTKESKGIFLRPPGLGLTELYESELRKDFANVDLTYLQQSLPQLFVEDLEIADDFQMTVEGSTIHVRITGSVFKDLCTASMEISDICGSIGCHLCSSIAIALAKALAKPIVIQETHIYGDSKTIEVYYKVVEE